MLNVRLRHRDEIEHVRVAVARGDRDRRGAKLALRVDGSQRAAVERVPIAVLVLPFEHAAARYAALVRGRYDYDLGFGRVVCRWSHAAALLRGVLSDGPGLQIHWCDERGGDSK